MRRLSLAKGVLAAGTMSMVLSACAGNPAEDDPFTVGFLYVGPTNDFGYNQAAYEGSQAVAEAFPDARILQAENVPETAEAERIMEKMIDSGADLIFPTSFGHAGPALNVARRHPDVIFMHEGGLETTPNFGTFFGSIWEGEYLAGQAAGLATETDQLGFVVAFPIGQSLLNVNFFQLGAQSVNPQARTTVVFTAAWCDPVKQAEAANALIDGGADVITQHQDCAKTVVETAERRGVLTTGYHFDASELAPGAWLTGVNWNWGPLFTDIVRTVRDGQWVDSPYSGQFLGGFAEGVVQRSSFGEPATPEIRRQVDQSLAELEDGSLQPFRGPIRDQDGRVRVEPGQVPDATQLQSIDYFVEGVRGRIPRS